VDPSFCALVALLKMKKGRLEPATRYARAHHAAQFGLGAISVEDVVSKRSTYIPDGVGHRNFPPAERSTDFPTT